MTNNQRLADKMRMKKECMERIALSLGREISASEASDIFEGIRAGMVKVRQADPDKWATMTLQERADAAGKLYQASLKAEAEKIKQRAYLTVIRQDAINRRAEYHRQRGYRGLAITQAILEDTNRKVLATQNEYVTAFAAELEGKLPGFMGLFADKNFERAVVQEIYGVDTGRQLAKQVAQLFTKVSEQERLRYNSAGGNMGKIDHYMPQTHNVVRMAHAADVIRGYGRLHQLYNDVVNTLGPKVNKHDINQATWVAYVANLLDREKYLDANGDVMGDADFYQMLARVYDTIITSGDQDFEVSTVAGNSTRSFGGNSASRANRGDNHRALHFRDADAFFAYQQAFGQGDVIGTMLGHIRRTAKDIALLEELGPNPNNMVRGMIRTGEAEANQGRLIHGILRGKVSVHLVDASWATLNGDANRVIPGREIFASIMQGARNMEVVGKLQSTFISSLSDLPTYFLSSGLYKVPALDAVQSLFLSAFGKQNRDLMVRAGVMADSLASSITRWGENNLGQGWTGMLANATMKVSLLDWWTNSVRQASMMNMMGALSKITKVPWDKLDGYTKNALERAGVDERIWRIWGEAKHTKRFGTSFLTTQDVREIDIQAIRDGKLQKLLADNALTQRDIDRAATTLISFLTDESGMASLNPDLFTRGMANLGYEKGTVRGEVWRSFMLFKSFPIGFMRRHLERMSDLATTRGKADAAKYAAMVMTTTTLAGAMSVQLKELLAGRDPQDESTADFWLQAMSVGGGAGFLSDVIVSGLDGENAYGSPNFIRFMGPVFGTVLDTFDAGKSYLTEGLYNKDTKANAKTLRLLRGHAPFVNLWYAKGVFDRAIYNDLMEMASPGYLARVEKNAMKQKGVGYWWDQNRLIPRRAPDFDVQKPERPAR